MERTTTEYREVKGLGKVLYETYPIYHHMTLEHMGYRTRPVYTAEQQDILDARAEKLMKAAKDGRERRELERNRYAEEHFSFTVEDLNEATDYYKKVSKVRENESHIKYALEQIARLQEDIERCKAQNGELNEDIKAVRANPERVEFFEGLAKDECKVLVDANKELEENKLRKFPVYDLKGAYFGCGE